MISLTNQMQSRFYSLAGRAKYLLFEHQFVYTVRIGLAVTSILLTVLAVALMSRNPVYGLVAVGAVAACFVFVFVWHYMEITVFLLIVVSTVVNPVIPRDITVTLLLLILLGFVWILKLLISGSFQSVRPAPPNKAAVLFIVAVIISYIWSSIYADPNIVHMQNDKFLPRLITGLVMILSPLAMLLFGNFMKTTAAMKRVVWYYLIFGAVVLLLHILPVTVSLSFINAGGQLPAWVTIFALSQVLYNKDIPRWLKLGLWLLVAGWLYVQFWEGRTWVSGWLPAFVGIAVLVLLRSRLLFAAAVAVAMIAAVANIEMIEEMIEAERQESGDTRLAAAMFFVDVTAEHYLFGTGPTGPYFYLLTYGRGLQLSHNNYVDIITQTGIFGFVSWILLWGSICWTAWKNYRAGLTHGFEAGLSAALLAISAVTLLIMALGDWVTPFTYTQSVRGVSYTIWPWLWAGLSIALYAQIQARKQDSQSQRGVVAELNKDVV
ncbi:MAG TPA: O-antigen ligase family protein [Spirillospora sp.]|nr:O-antigen ligase family protein [Spirillospora sp.]